MSAHDQRNARRRAFGHELDVDVFGRPVNQPPGTAERGPALEHQLKRASVGCDDGAQRLHHKPILLHQGRAWQGKLGLDLDEVLQAGPIGQPPAPNPCLSGGAKSGPSPAARADRNLGRAALVVRLLSLGRLPVIKRHPELTPWRHVKLTPSG
jgi:hypothetical protein